MKEVTVKNDYYTFYIDKEKNRFYSYFTKVWYLKEEVPSYHDDIKKSVEKLKPGFTAVCNGVQIQGLVAKNGRQIEFGKIHVEGSKIADSYQQKKVAVIMKEGSFITKTILETIIAPLKKFKLFDSEEEAEKWLDQN